MGSLPRFQVETSRVLVLTTTATSEDVLLIIDMEYQHQHKADTRRLEEREETIQHGEIVEIVEETLEEINANFPLENVDDNFHDPLLSPCEVPRPRVIICDRENIHGNNNNELDDESFEEVNFSLKLPPTGTNQIEDSVMEEIVEYCDISDESDDEDYEYYYEEVTDDDESDDDKKLA